MFEKLRRVNLTQKETRSSQFAAPAENQWTLQVAYLFIVSTRGAVNNLHLWTWQDYFGRGFSRSESWCVCVHAHVHSVHASVVQESARFYRHTKRSLVKSKGTSVKVGQGVSHHMTCIRLLTNVSLLPTHTCKHAHARTDRRLFCDLASHENWPQWPQAWKTYGGVGRRMRRLSEEGIDGGIVKGGVDLTGLERRKGH